MWNFQVWQAVVVDLWHFVWGARFTPLLQLPSRSVSSRPFALTTATPRPAALPLSVVTPASAPLYVPATPDERYVLATSAAVSLTPYQSFDSIITSVHFGEAVTVRAYHGQYAQIMTAVGPGWVHKDILETDRACVWPNLTNDTLYQFDNVATHIIRRHLHDEFNAGKLQLPLQSVEYVTYRLTQSKHVINWDTTRPRVPGLWQQLLKGRPGIHIGVQPLADSIMEYRDSEGNGALLYVETVAPDNTLNCSSVGLDEAGKYTSAIYTESMWREWAPVFIDVTS